MANTSGILAGKAYVQFLIDDEQLKAGLNKVQQKMASFGRMGAGIGGAVTAAFGGLAAKFADTGGSLWDMHERTGLSVESLSELSYAATQAGTDMATVEQAVKHLQKNGIDPANFDKIAADLSGITDQTERAKAAFDIFGKAGLELLPMLDGLPQVREEARKMGIVMTTDMAQAADALGYKWELAKAQLGAVAAQVGMALAGPLTSLLQWVNEILVPTIEFVREHKTLVIVLAAAAAITTIASVAMMGLASVIGAITTIMGAASAVAGVLGISLGALSAGPILAGLAAVGYAVYKIWKWFKGSNEEADKFAANVLEMGKQDPAAATKAAGLAGMPPEQFQQILDLQARIGNQNLSSLSPVTPRMESAAFVAGGLDNNASALLKAIASSNQEMNERDRLRKYGIPAVAM